MDRVQAIVKSTTRHESFEDECLRSFTVIYKYVRAGVGNDPDAEDLTQDVFALAFSKKDQFVDGDMEAWLYRIARNRLSMFYRRKGLEQKGCDVLIAGKAPTRHQESSEPQEHSTLNEFKGAAYQAMMLLGAAEQEAIRLKFAQAFSNARIAALLGVTPGHLGVMLHRALRKMRIQLEAWGYE